jgi:hypothetical protein
MTAVIPSWLYRWLMPVVWLAAIIVSVASDTGALCSADDPSICGPDRTFSLAMIACFASLVLLWWQPTVAAASGVLFLVIDLQYDDVAGARVAWTVYGALCVALLVATAISRRAQRSASADLPRRQVMVPAAAPVRVSGRLLVAGALVLVGAGALGIMHWQDQREAVHVRRAIEQTGLVETMKDDGDLVLRMPDGSKRTVTMLDDYDTGASIPVLLDPADHGWIRPRAEPADYTGWYTVAGGAWALAILLVARDLRLRRARPRRAWTEQGLPVRIEPDSSTAFAIRSTDDAVLLGFLVAEVDDEETDARLFDAFDVLDDETSDQAPAALKREWEQTLGRYRGDALLVGDLVEGSWPSIVIGDQVLRPVAPFRAPRRLPWRAESVSGSLRPVDSTAVRNSSPSKRTVEPALELPTLPWEVPLQSRPWWDRPALVAVLIVAPIAVGTLAVWGEWVAAIGVGLLGGNVIHFVGGRTFYRVIATATEVRIRAGWFERALAWRSVDSVEVDKDRLNLEAGDDWHVVGGVEENQVARTAAVFETLRLRGNTGVPTEIASRRPAPVLALDCGYLLVCALILVLARWS